MAEGTQTTTQNGPGAAARGGQAAKRRGAVQTNREPVIPVGYTGPKPNDLGLVAITFLHNVGQYNAGEVAGFPPAQAHNLVQGRNVAVYGAETDLATDGQALSDAQEEQPRGPLHENGNNAGQTAALSPAENGTEAIVLPGDWRNTFGPSDKRKIAAAVERQTKGADARSYQELTVEAAEQVLDEFYSRSARPDAESAQIAREQRGVAVLGRAPL